MFLISNVYTLPNSNYFLVIKDDLGIYARNRDEWGYIRKDLWENLEEGRVEVESENLHGKTEVLGNIDIEKVSSK